jgi:hypothetical protein
MPCLIHYSEVGQVVILEGENVRRFFPAEGPAEWEALIKALKAEAVADATVERINGASIEDLVAQYQAQKAHEKVKVYDQKGKPKLELKDLGL